MPARNFLCFRFILAHLLLGGAKQFSNIHLRCLTPAYFLESIANIHNRPPLHFGIISVAFAIFNKNIIHPKICIEKRLIRRIM